MRLETTVGKDGLATAVFDTRRLYRYRLSRVWDPVRPRLGWCLLNPSTADATTTDPTLGRIVGFSRGWGYGAAEVVNLFAWRASHPDRLHSASDPVGPGNDEAIVGVVGRADAVVAAWGNLGLLRNPVSGASRCEEVGELLSVHDVAVMCLGVTRLGQPRHPLYSRADMSPRPWVGP